MGIETNRILELELKWRTNLVVPSKNWGGSEVESSGGGRTSFTVLLRERERERERVKLERVKLTCKPVLFVALIF